MWAFILLRADRVYNNLLRLIYYIIFLFEDTLEHVTFDSQFQARRDRIQEIIQLSLLITRLNDSLEVLSDFFSQIFRQRYIFHSRVSIVYSVLLILRFTTDLSNQNCKLAKNVGLKNGSSQIYDHHEN